MQYFPDDMTLLFAFQNGEAPAEKALFDRYFQPLCLFSERITSDLQQSEDIVADSFEKLIDRRMDFNSVPKLKSFLYKTVHNASINEVIAKQRHEAVHQKIIYLNKSNNSLEDPLEMEILRAELIHEIYMEMENLPERCRQIFKMIFVNELSTEEIAARLNINVQTVRTQKARAIQLIRSSLLKKNRIPTLLFFGAIASFGSHF